MTNWTVETWQKLDERRWLACTTDIYRQSTTALIPCYRAIVDWALKMGVRSVGGPLFSGALVAHGISLISRGKIEFFQIPGGKTSTRHVRKIYARPVPPILLVDDMVESGATMERSIYQLLSETDAVSFASLVGILTFDVFLTSSFGNFLLWNDKPILERLYTQKKIWALTQRKKR